MDGADCHFGIRPFPKSHWIRGFTRLWTGRGNHNGNRDGTDVAGQIINRFKGIVRCRLEVERW